MAVLITLIIVGSMLTYCWISFITTDYIATWRHYAGLLMYLILVAVLFKNLQYATILLGLYLLFAAFALIAITPGITTSWVKIGPISTPPVQLLSLGIFILYAILNFYPLVDWYLEYTERQAERKKPRAGNGNPVKVASQHNS